MQKNPALNGWSKYLSRRYENHNLRGECMKININGLTREMTAEEIAEMEAQQAELPEPEPSPEERVEAQVLYTALMTDTLLEV